MTEAENPPKRNMEEILAEARSKLKALEVESDRAVSKVSLIAESPLSIKSMEVAAFYLGLVYADVAKKQTPWKISAFFNDHSGIIAHVMAGIGYRNYNQGAYWDGFFEQLHLSNKLETGRFAGKSRAEISTEWGDCFLNALKSRGLPTFSGFAQKYVVPIMVHAGIPISALPNYFSALDRCLQRVGFNAEAIANQLNNPYAAERYGTNKPVLRFLEYGGEFAIEFVDRSLDALAKLARDESLDSHPLPPEVLSAVVEFFNHPQQRSISIGRNTNILKAGKLSVVLDAPLGELTLELPEISTDLINFKWHIGFDESRVEFEPRTLSGGDFGRRGGVKLAIEKPVRQIQVEASDGLMSREITLYSSETPAIFFTPVGELIPNNVALPKGLIYVLTAKGREKAFNIEDPRIQQEIPPLGWHAWELYRVDLSNSLSFKLFEIGETRNVATKAKATIDVDQTIDGLTYRGLPVQIARPLITFPEGVEAEWQIEIRNLSDSKLSVQNHKTHSTTTLQIDPFSGSNFPLLGEYQILVRGPLGLGASQKIVVAEGLKLTSPTEWRSIVDGGLSEYIAEFTSADFKVSPQLTYFSSSSNVETIEVSHNKVAISFLFRPPAFAIAHRFKGVPQPWRYGPVTVNLEDIDSSEIVLRVPPRYSKAQLSIVQNANIYQSISTSLSKNDQLLDFELGNFSAELKHLKEVELFLDYGGLNLRVGRIRPQKIASEIQANQYDVTLSDFVGGKVIARIWSANEPWQEYADVEVPPSGIFRIPENFIGLGNLCIQLELHDPWANSSLQDFPAKDDFFFVRLPSVSGNLSAAGEAIETGRFTAASKIDRLSKCWFTLHFYSLIGDRVGLSLDVVRAVTKLVRENPIRALEVLSQANISFEDSLVAISLSGVLSADIQLQPKTKLSDGDFAARISRAPAPMLLSATATLMQGRSPKDFGRSWDQINSKFGLAFRDVAVTGQVEDFKVGSFVGMETVLMADPSRAEAFVELTGAYPREYLHSDSRLLAGLELFKQRESFTLVTKNLSPQKILAELHKEFLLPMPYANDYISTRMPNSGVMRNSQNWMFLPALCLALSFLNRGNAHGVLSTFSSTSRTSEIFHAFAKHSPRLFFADLALADLIILTQNSTELPIFELEEELDQ